MRFTPRVYAKKTPDKPAYIMAESGEVVTYRQLEERANQCAHLFRKVGLRVGDHIAILMENNSRFLEIVWAAQRSGLYYTAVSRHLTTHEIEYIVNDCEAKVLITSTTLSSVAGPLIDKIPRVHTKLVVYGSIPGYTRYEPALESCPTTPIINEIEGAPMLYTSGSTGQPKGIINTDLTNPFDEDVEASPYPLFDYIGYSQSTTYLSPAPLYHAAPLYYILAVHRYGGTAIIMDKFGAVESLALIEKHKVSHAQWVPTMFVRMLKLPDEERLKYDVSSMQMAVHGAGPIAVSTKERMIAWWGPKLLEYYMGTEGNGLTMITSEEWLEHKGSVGRSALGTIHILDAEENELPVGEVGSIYFSGGNSFEYHNAPEKTKESFTSKGWSTMGDIGCLDKDGYLYLKDRKADMIISGGVNIYPQEAEKVLIEHDAVMDVAVFGVPNEDFGEEVKAVVQPMRLAEAGPDLEKKLIAYCQSKISKIKCPVSIDFKEEFPRTPTGKLIKRKLKETHKTARLSSDFTTHI